MRVLPILIGVVLRRNHYALIEKEIDPSHKRPEPLVLLIPVIIPARAKSPIKDVLLLNRFVWMG